MAPTTAATVLVIIGIGLMNIVLVGLFVSLGGAVGAVVAAVVGLRNSKKIDNNAEKIDALDSKVDILTGRVDELSKTRHSVLSALLKSSRRPGPGGHAGQPDPAPAAA